MAKIFAGKQLIIKDYNTNGRLIEVSRNMVAKVDGQYFYVEKLGYRRKYDIMTMKEAIDKPRSTAHI